MADRKSILAPAGLIQLALALYFGVSGLVFLLNYDKLGQKLSRAFGQDQTLMVIAAIVQLVVAIVLIVALIISIDRKFIFIGGIAIMVLWIIQMLMAHVLDNHFLEPNFLAWLQPFSLDLIILAGLWQVTANKA